MRYDNERCQVCSEAFTPEDDIVVCPECGAPMHRKCWKENGGCVNAYKHGEYTWTPSNKSKADDFDKTRTPGIICPRCGNNCAPDMLACPNCGMQLMSEEEKRGNSRSFIPDLSTEDGRMNFFMHGVNAKSDEEIDGVKIGDIAVFVQSNTARIIEKFKRINKDRKITWNWGAFFFAQFWFIYRKMFKIGIVVLALSLAVSIFRMIPEAELISMTNGYIEEMRTVVEESQSGKISSDEFESRAKDIYAGMRKKLAENPKVVLQYTISTAILFIKNIACGLTGYWVYRKRVLENVKTARGKSGNDGEFMTYALRYGGVSALLFAASYFGSQLIIEFLSGYAM
ncbi:MAG: DUF2628 domain-containing protein [Clostridiales bacterium]|nr:DUF2628 domain-containing protein [Clostridiales bacterium]